MSTRCIGIFYREEEEEKEAAKKKTERIDEVDGNSAIRRNYASFET